MSVVAVSAPQYGTAKRGVAAGIARALAAVDAGRVCILDADPQSREVGWRFGVVAPTVDHVAGVLASNPIADPFGLMPRDEHTGCWVVPLGRDGDPHDRDAYELLVRRLRDHLDFLVIDAPVAYTLHSRRIDGLVDEVDELLVATATEPAAFPALLRYLNALTRGRITGELPPDLQVRVLPTGDELGEEAERWMDRAPRSVEFASVVPPLWGREAANTVDAGVVPDPLLDLVRSLQR
jgi:MinD-like ATPase involved in chromosome partitioning or flagellar assembly